MNQPLFSYGSLMDADVLRIVIGPEYDAVVTSPAQLAGFRCVQYPTETFPILHAETRKLVDGLLIDGLSALAYQRILFFEGDEYELQSCLVQTHGGEREALYCADVTEPGELYDEWTLARWQREHKAAFCVHVEQYMALFGTMSATEADQHWLAITAAGDRGIDRAS